MPVDTMTTDSIVGYTTTTTATTAGSYTAVSVADLATDAVVTLGEAPLPWAYTDGTVVPDPIEGVHVNDLTNTENSELDYLRAYIAYLETRTDGLERALSEMQEQLSYCINKGDLEVLVENLSDLFQRHFEEEQFEITPDELEALLYRRYKF